MCEAVFGQRKVAYSKTLSVFQGIFIKDSNSLAYYNMASGAVIHLALKERGGRKK